MRNISNENIKMYKTKFIKYFIDYDMNQILYLVRYIINSNVSHLQQIRIASYSLFQCDCCRYLPGSLHVIGGGGAV